MRKKCTYEGDEGDIYSNIEENLATLTFSQDIILNYNNINER